VPLNAHPVVLACLRELPQNARIGVAVSGGGDSVALLLWLVKEYDFQVFAATVNHNLRPAAAAEAAFVARLCQDLGVPHVTLDCAPGGMPGNLQANARALRYLALADWGKAENLTAICLGHTQDDQAETLLLRLARGSGVDGLSGMAAVRAQDGITWLRPFLSEKRAALREYLDCLDQGWVEDPSNDDSRFSRVQMRQAMAGLADLGLSVDRLTQTADQMARARVALGQAAVDLAVQVVRVRAGDVLLDRARLLAAPEELRLRLWVAALMWVGNTPYRPRLKEVQAAVGADAPRTLNGCLITPQADHWRVSREYNAVLGARCAAMQVWDGRWRADGPGLDGLTIAAIGDALPDCPDWRGAGLPYPAARAAPALWRGKTLVAAPLAGWPQGYRLTCDHRDYERMLLSR
jgi:tRNA(Ile)-lysidine synthase